MAIYSVKLNLPEQLYEHFKQRAAITSRSVEDEVVETLLSTTQDDPLPTNLANKLDAMHLLEDDALWNAARSHLAKLAAEQLESLNLKQQREGLTHDEREQLEHLASQYEQAMLIRAKAASLLKMRGHDISSLAT